MADLAETIAWIAVHNRCLSVANLIPDDAEIARSVCKKLAKHARQITYRTIRPAKGIAEELSGQYPGLRFETLTEGAALNADLVLLDDPDLLAKVWHNPLVALLGGKDVPMYNAIGLGPLPDGKYLWVNPANRVPATEFKVYTRNCVDDGIIQENLVYSLGLGLPHLPRCVAHGRRAIMCSAGPSLVNHIEEIREESKNGVVVCVKHSHDLLLDMGVVPFACVLLDPRSHVRDFIDTPHPDVNYFVSSTCNPSTFDRLLAHDAKVWVYHAMVGAGEQSMVKLRNSLMGQSIGDIRRLAAQAGITVPDPGRYWKSDMLVAGGTTSASRGISVLHMVGFRHFVLFGYDSCYWDKPDMTTLDNEGRPRYHDVTINGNQYWTDAELTAQVQDFQHLLKEIPDVTWEARGNGIVQDTIRNWRTETRRFEDVW